MRCKSTVGMCKRLLSQGSPTPAPESTACISIFFSDCDVLNQNHELLSSLGFETIHRVKGIKSGSLLSNFKSSMVSSGSVAVELISDPTFTRLRKTYGKLNSFARLLEIRKSSSKSIDHCTSPYRDGSIFKGLYPLTAITKHFPYHSPLFSVESRSPPLSTGAIDTTKKRERHFDFIKEIIVPCSAVSNSTLDEIQTILEASLGATPMSRNLPGLYQIALTSEKKLIMRTAPTDTCTIILKVDDLNSASEILRALNALGDCMGRSGTAQNGEIQINMPGLDGGVEFRVTDSHSVSAFYAEPPQSVIAGTLPEMQSPRVLAEGGGTGTAKELKPSPVVTGDCWKEVRTQLRNSLK